MVGFHARFGAKAYGIFVSVSAGERLFGLMLDKICEDGTSVQGFLATKRHDDPSRFTAIAVQLSRHILPQNLREIHCS